MTKSISMSVYVSVPVLLIAFFYWEHISVQKRLVDCRVEFLIEYDGRASWLLPVDGGKPLLIGEMVGAKFQPHLTG
jgi:hypothetical protein